MINTRKNMQPRRNRKQWGLNSLHQLKVNILRWMLIQKKADDCIVETRNYNTRHIACSTLTQELLFMADLS